LAAIATGVTITALNWDALNPGNWFVKGERNWEKGRGNDPFWDETQYPIDVLKRMERNRDLDANIRERAKRIRKQREKKGGNGFFFGRDDNDEACE
jgi:hypothetical protein